MAPITMNGRSVWRSFYTPLMGAIVYKKRDPRVCSQALNNSALIAAGVRQAATELLVVLTT